MKARTISNAGKQCCAPLQCSTKPPQHLLGADDDSDIRRLNAEEPKRGGCHVDTAKDGDADRKVLHAASHAPDSYDFLTADRDMPGLSGLCLVKNRSPGGRSGAL